MPNKGLNHEVQGEKEGSGGQMAKIFVAIAYSSGLILCKQYTEIHSQLSSLNISHIHSLELLTQEIKCSYRTIIFVRAPKSSKVGCDAMDEVGCRTVSISPRSPDVNPIENIFHISTPPATRRCIDEMMKLFRKTLNRLLKIFQLKVLIRPLTQ